MYVGLTHMYVGLTHMYVGLHTHVRRSNTHVRRSNTHVCLCIHTYVHMHADTHCEVHKLPEPFAVGSL